MSTRILLMSRLATGDSSNATPLVGLDDFFGGNRDLQSIGATGNRRIDPQDFYGELKGIGTHADVHEIVVELLKPKRNIDWPSTDTIWIVTSMTRSDVPKKLFSSTFWAKFLPDDWLSYPRLDSRSVESLLVPAGMNAFGLWYN